MIRKINERVTDVNPAMRGGPGEVIKTAIASPEELMGKGRMYAVLRLEPGCGVGPHSHSGETEIFLVLQGEAEYLDGDTVKTIRKGDVAICPDGGTHSVTNTGTETAEIAALILYA